MPIKGGGCVYFSPLAYWKDDRSKMLSRTTEELHDDVLQLLLSGEGTHNVAGGVCASACSSPMLLICIALRSFLVPLPAAISTAGLIPVQQRVVLGCMTKVPNPIYQGDYLVTHVGALIFSCKYYAICTP